MSSTTKFALFGSLALLSLIYSDLLAMLGVLIALLVISRMASIWKRAALFIRAFAVFSVIVFAINMVANQNGAHILIRTSFRFYIWTISYRLTLESVSGGVKMVLRLLSLVLCFVIFTMTTNPERLLNRFSSIVGFREFGLLLALSYRFLPTLVSDGRMIRDSLRSRGVDFESTRKRERIAAYASLAVPLVMNSLERSIQLAEAMESRGYGCCPRRSAGRHLPGLTPLAAWYIAVFSLLVFLFVSLSWGRSVLFSGVPGLILLLLLPSLYTAPLLWRSKS